MRPFGIALGVVALLVLDLGCDELSGFGSQGSRCPPELHTTDCIGSWDSQTCTCTPQRSSSSSSAGSLPAACTTDDDCFSPGYHCVEPFAGNDGCAPASTFCVSDRDCPRDARCAFDAGKNGTCVASDTGEARRNDCDDDDECRSEEGATCWADSCFGPREVSLDGGADATTDGARD